MRLVGWCLLPQRWLCFGGGGPACYPVSAGKVVQEKEEGHESRAKTCWL